MNSAAEELLAEVINRIATLNPKLNAIEQKNYDLAREQARRGLPSGPSTLPKLAYDTHGIKALWSHDEPLEPLPD